MHDLNNEVGLYLRRGGGGGGGGWVFNEANSLQIQALKEGNVSQFKQNLSKGQDLFKMVSHNSAIN